MALDENAMGGVSDSVSVSRTSPTAPLASAISMAELAQAAAAVWMPPAGAAQDQATFSGAPFPRPAPAGQAQLQTLALVLGQTSPQSVADSDLRSLWLDSSEESAEPRESEQHPGAARRVTRQFQLARRTYAGAGDPVSLTISVVG